MNTDPEIKMTIRVPSWLVLYVHSYRLSEGSARDYISTLSVPPKVLNVRNYKLFNTKNFQSDLKTIPMEHIKLVSKDANEAWLRWKAFFLNILNKHALRPVLGSRETVYLM